MNGVINGPTDPRARRRGGVNAAQPVWWRSCATRATSSSWASETTPRRRSNKSPSPGLTSSSSTFTCAAVRASTRSSRSWRGRRRRSWCCPPAPTTGIRHRLSQALVAGALEALPRPRQWTPELGAELRRTVRLHQYRSRDQASPRRPAQRATARSHPATGRRPVVAIAASTGGPSALATVLSGLAGLQAPVLVVQHLHADFVAGLVQWMSRVSALPVEIASAHQIARPGADLPRARRNSSPSRRQPQTRAGRDPGHGASSFGQRAVHVGGRQRWVGRDRRPAHRHGRRRRPGTAGDTSPRRRHPRPGRGLLGGVRDAARPPSVSVR